MPRVADELLKRFVREAKVLSSLVHPLVPALLDFGITGECVYLTSAYEPGQNLRAYLTDRGRLPWREAVRLLDGIVDVLVHAHERGILHRDIKPENTLVLSDGTVRVIDFGLALADGQTRMTGPHALVGTIPYMCPAYLTEGLVDPRGDLSAAGIIAHEMLCRHPTAALRHA